MSYANAAPAQIGFLETNKGNRSMPKLLFATTVPVTLRGFLLPFAAHFRAAGWRVDAMAKDVSASPECVKGYDRVWDMSWSRNPLHPRNLLTMPARVRAIVAQEGYDLVHVHTPVAAFLTRMALRHMRKDGRPRVIYTAHGFHFYEGGPRIRSAMYRKLEQCAGAWTDFLVVINREDERAAHRYGIVPPDRIRFMPGIGVDTTHFGAAAISEMDVERLRRELGLVGKQRIILMLAEFNAGKRHRDALHALARLSHRDACLLFAGDGPLFEPTKQLAARLGVAERVRFLGYRRDVLTLIKASTAMLLPSEREGLPRSVMEAMCQGVPVIGSRIRGMTDLLENGRGLLVPVGDVQGFADAMAWILDHPGDARALGERGREAMPAYEFSNIVHLHQELYDEALGNQRAQRVNDSATCVRQEMGACL
jgi:glycosyltransferase involved in cell wall biosynthesis